MNFKSLSLILVLTITSISVSAQKSRGFEVKSLDGKIVLNVEVGSQLLWSVNHLDRQIISASSISLQLQNGEILGKDVKLTGSSLESFNTEIHPVLYKKSVIHDEYNQLTLKCKGDYSIVFRVYNEGVAYRFITKRKGEITIKNEEANFNFTDDYQAFIPYMWDYRENLIFNTSFESLYRRSKISEFSADSLAFLPLLVDAGNDIKIAILEADLEDYPGMFLNINQSRKGFMGVFAPYPIETKPGGHGQMNLIPVKRADYIAKISGTRSFPWRVVVISQNDKELLDNDMVQKLASPPRLEDISWIIPGQVSWDWWNNWNISHVDFRAGINTETYKYYIDFASANNIKYIIMDDGWSERLDLTKIAPEINLEEIVEYGKQKKVGVILWASWNGVMKQKDIIFPLYSKMGVKGFKIDFIDRDDQLAVASTYEIARDAAEYHLLVDYHGIYKPTGLQRTYPNVIGYEGVKGMENVKWAIEDVPRYDVTIPFIRMLSGQMDYTPGAMRNATRGTFHPVGSNPMSQGTRSHQLAMYVVFEAPLQMLSDNPTIYMKEQECTDFITSIPTIYDETVALDGKVGEYAVIARRNGDTWYVGAMTNWDPRALNIDFSFLGSGNYEAVVFGDGINADRDATDYKREIIKLSSGEKLNIRLAPGGGWAAVIKKSN